MLKICDTLDGKCPGSALAIVALHAFTGTDFTSAFYRRGKVVPLNVMLGDESGKFRSFFQSLSMATSTDISIAEEYVCRLYGSNANKLNKARVNKL